MNSMTRKPMSINLQPISPESRTKILSNFVEVPGDKGVVQNYCVDGRKGKRQTIFGSKLEGAYVQSLGGSLHQAVLNWLLVKPQEPFDKVVNDTFNTLKIGKKYRIGLHKGHKADGKEKSDCGFADNLGKIISTLAKNDKEIWEILVKEVPSLETDISTWKEIIRNLSQLDINNLPNGHNLVDSKAADHHSDIQFLDGDHKEIAAVVNTQPNTTLNVDDNQETQAFNLDLWWVLKQAAELGIDETKAKLLSLGLYVATEKVLVEEKRGIRLPIIVR